MPTPSITTVKEQVEGYRKTRSYRKQRIPYEFIANLRILVRFLPISKLQREIKLS